MPYALKTEVFEIAFQSEAFKTEVQHLGVDGQTLLNSKMGFSKAWR